MHLHASHDDTSISIGPTSTTAPQSSGTLSSATQSSAPQSSLSPSKHPSQQSAPTSEHTLSAIAAPSQSTAPASSPANEPPAQGTQTPHADLASQDSPCLSTILVRDQQDGSEAAVPSGNTVTASEAGEAVDNTFPKPAPLSNEQQSACLFEPSCSSNRLWQLRDGARAQQYLDALGHVLIRAGSSLCCRVLHWAM